MNASSTFSRSLCWGGLYRGELAELLDITFFERRVQDGIRISKQRPHCFDWLLTKDENTRKTKEIGLIRSLSQSGIFNFQSTLDGVLAVNAQAVTVDWGSNEASKVQRIRVQTDGGAKDTLSLWYIEYMFPSSQKSNCFRLEVRFGLRKPSYLIEPSPASSSILLDPA